MKDRFKFRIWHKPLKQMHYNDFVITATGYCAKIYQQDDYMMKFNQGDLEFDKQCVVMQCIGLKDKNDKLIYEGDVVFKKGSKNYKGEKMFSKVLYSNDSAAFMISDENGLHQIPHNSSNIEIIGNIYENPELIRGQNV